MDMRLTKREWYAQGGLANPELFRKQHPSGAWTYWKRGN
jgi:hypothetical protein